MMANDTDPQETVTGSQDPPAESEKDQPFQLSEAGKDTEEPAPSGDTTDSTTEEPPKLFTQDDMDRVVAKRAARAADSASKKAVEDFKKEHAHLMLTAEQVEEYQTLTTEREERRRKRMEDKEQYEKLLEEERARFTAEKQELNSRLEALETERTAELTRRRQSDKRARVMAYAEQYGAHNAAIVADLTDRFFELGEDGRLVAKSFYGETKPESVTLKNRVLHIETVTPEEWYEYFFSTNPYLRRASRHPGTGTNVTEDPVPTPTPGEISEEEFQKKSGRDLIGEGIGTLQDQLGMVRKRDEARRTS